MSDTTVLTPGSRYRPEELLPHRGRMLLLDEIDDYGADWVRSIVRIRSDSLLATATGVPAWVGIEYMAQTAAAWSGIELLQMGQRPRIAFLLGSRRFHCSSTAFLPGMDLRISARILLQDASDLAIFECDIHHDGQRLAHADIKAYRPRDVAAFLKQGF